MQVLLVFVLIVLGIVITHRLMFRGKTGAGSNAAEAAIATAHATATASAENQARKDDARANRGDNSNNTAALASDDKTPTPAPTPVPVRHDRLRGEPSVMEAGPFSIEVTIDIPRTKSELIEALDACGALLDDWPESKTRRASFDVIPDALLPQALFTDGEPVSLMLVVNGGRPILGLWYGYGPPAKLEEELVAFLDAPPGWYKLVQERGDFADGKYFTTDHLLDIEGDEVSGALGIRVITRERLRAEIRAATATLWERVANAGAVFPGTLREGR